MKLPILLETAQYIVLNKPPYVYCQPPVDRKHYTNTIGYHLSLQYKLLYNVHRLDYNVSGAVCVALTKSAAQGFSKNLRLGGNSGNLLERKYIAVVKANGVGCGPISEQGIVEQEIDGKPARTKYKVLDSWDDRKLVIFKLYTGRKHQIRIHINSLGYHILNDLVYGESASVGHNPIALHAGYMRTKIGLKEYETFANVEHQVPLKNLGGWTAQGRLTTELQHALLEM